MTKEELIDKLFNMLDYIAYDVGCMSEEEMDELNLLAYDWMEISNED